MVMANLRKRVAAIDLSRIVRRSNNDDSNANDTGQLTQQHMLQQQQQELLDNRPLLPKVCLYYLTKKHFKAHQIK